VAGRPRKYSDDAVQRIEQAVTAGATYRLACQYAGISEDTFSAWRKRYPDFSERLARAESNAALRWLAKIEQLADQENDWRALAWKLERRYPQEYGKTTQDVQHSGTVVQEHTGAVEVRAVDYRHSIRAIVTSEDREELAG
jgi:CHASE1-domain containing sensor protein